MKSTLSMPAEMYLDLLKQSLTGHLQEGMYRSVDPPRGSLAHLLYRPLHSVLRAGGFELVRNVTATQRHEGRDWPAQALTMGGRRRLDNLQACIADVIAGDVRGDLLEAGAWRGGASILMRAVLKTYGEVRRVVWVADSFRGLPKPDPARYPADADDRLWSRPQLAVSLEEVRANFERYGLLDDQVRFLPGWFAETLPRAPIEHLAVLRVDADMYQSTLEALEHLYPRLSVGGYAIIDDYGALPNCRAAVDDFRTRYSIDQELVPIDWTGVFWKKTGD